MILGALGSCDFVMRVSIALALCRSLQNSSGASASRRVTSSQYTAYFTLPNVSELVYRPIATLFLSPSMQIAHSSLIDLKIYILTTKL